MKKYLLTLLFFFFFSLLTAAEEKIAFASSPSPIAQVVAVRGDVEAIGIQGTRPLSMKAPIYESDRIKTGKRGKIQLMFTDNTLISLGRNSDMMISEYNWDDEKKSGAIQTEVKEGTFRVMGGALAKFTPQTFTTKTPSATIGIRGSMYAGTVNGLALSVLFQGGKGIDIMNASGSVAITRPGFGTHVLNPNKPPLPPAKFSTADLASINEGLTGVEPPNDGDEPATEGDDPQAKDNKPPQKDEKAPPEDDQVPPKADKPSRDKDGALPPEEDNQPKKGDGPPAGKKQAQTDNDKPPADGSQPPPDGKQPPPRGPMKATKGEMPPKGAMVMTPDGEMIFVPEGTKAPEGSVPPPDGQMVKTPDGQMVFVPDGAEIPMGSTPMPDEMGPPPPGQIVYTQEGDLMFVPEGMKPPEGSTPPPEGMSMEGQVIYIPKGMEPPPEGMMASPDGMIREPMMDPMTGEPMMYPMPGDPMMPPPDGMNGEPMMYPMPGDPMMGSYDPMMDPMYDPMMPAFDPMMDPMFDPMYNPMYDPMMAFDPMKDPKYDPGNYYDPTTDPNYQSIATGDPNVTPTWMPTSGIDGYSGSFILNVGGVAQTMAAIMEINWFAGTGFGIVLDPGYYGPPAFFFGQVSGTSLTNIKLFGTDGTQAHESPVAGESGGSGVFKGADHQYFDMSISGLDYDLRTLGTPSIGGNWNALATTGITPQAPEDTTSPTGTALWDGYVVAISENVNNISQRKAYMNSDDSGFAITLNRNSGTVTGSINAPQLTPSPSPNPNAKINVSLGGAGQSAYILDDHFGAIINSGGVEDDTITATNPLNPHGNYLTTEDPDKNNFEYMSWGYWEISHRERGADNIANNADDEMWHTHLPYTMWVAGEKTSHIPGSETYIEDLIKTTTFVGNYTGFAQGSRITGGGVQFLPGGTLNLTVDFSKGQVAGHVGTADAITGSINFPNVITLNIDSGLGALTSSDFHANIAGTVSSAVNGSFYGPKVDSVGGNFNAQFATETYIGIFGGNLANSPAP